MLVAGSSMKEIVNLKASLAKKFSMKDLDPVRKFLKRGHQREKVVESIIVRVREECAEKI